VSDLISGLTKFLEGELVVATFCFLHGQNVNIVMVEEINH